MMGTKNAAMNDGNPEDTGPVGGARRRYPDGGTKVAEDKAPAAPPLGGFPETPYVGHFKIAPNVLAVTIEAVEEGSFIIRANEKTYIAAGPEAAGGKVAKVLKAMLSPEGGDTT